ncbi:hypothetical protein COK37_28640 [Bacillus thuringiensis]|nr:hypothetical protein COK37_28640 [Bacillus thuringiensis]PFT80458.1 hypothetical protein COK70_11685 [Bacillus thuringiensis]PFV91013.1 hypothetical protein COL06_07030 [Bacillus thuringiensis]
MFKNAIIAIGANILFFVSFVLLVHYSVVSNFNNLSYFIIQYGMWGFLLIISVIFSIIAIYKRERWKWLLIFNLFLALICLIPVCIVFSIDFTYRVIGGH